MIYHSILVKANLLIDHSLRLGGRTLRWAIGRQHRRRSRRTLQLSGRLRLPARRKVHNGFSDVNSLTRAGTKSRSGHGLVRDFRLIGTYAVYFGFADQRALKNAMRSDSS
jgi:hypothetical protein